MQPRLRPDIGWRDLASALLPLSRTRADSEAAIANQAAPQLSAVVGLSVRSLFHALLAERGGGRPVAMSAVTIADMANLVRAHGCEVRPVDIDIETLMPAPAVMQAACADDAGMVVIAHLYGARAPMQPLADLCRAPGRLIIEDCAQAFDGKLSLSAGADVALYSFGPIKTATALGGAIALFHDPALAEAVRRRMADWPTMPDGWFRRRALKYAALKLLATPWLYGLFLAVLSRIVPNTEATLGKMARGFGNDKPIGEAVQYRPPARLLRLLQRRLTNWTPRAETSGELLERLSSRVTVPGIAQRPHHWWLAPILTTDPNGLIAKLRGLGFDATRGTTSMRALADVGGKSPETAARLISSVVYLPKPASSQTASKLAGAVERSLS